MHAERANAQQARSALMAMMMLEAAIAGRAFAIASRFSHLIYCRPISSRVWRQAIFVGLD
jgi:hypothetical protein